MTNKYIMVTIRVLAYNHEKYIRHCLESILNQKTNVDYEVLIHEDASSDKTADIIQEYMGKYPDKIIAILRKENQYSSNIEAINQWFEENTHGKYIAYCEGDDYWTDEYKLQKQVDYLEQHQEVGLVAHRFYIVDDDEKMIKISHQGERLNRLFNKEDALRLYSDLFHPNSMMYRYEIEQTERYKKGLKECSIVGSHTFFTLYFTAVSDIYISSDIMSAWRYNPNGTTSFATRYNLHPITYSIISVETTAKLRKFFAGEYNLDAIMVERAYYAFIALLKAREDGISHLTQFVKLWRLTQFKDRIGVIRMLVVHLIGRK